MHNHKGSGEGMLSAVGAVLNRKRGAWLQSDSCARSDGKVPHASKQDPPGPSVYLTCFNPHNKSARACHKQNIQLVCTHMAIPGVKLLK